MERRPGSGVKTVDREGERVGRLVDAEVLPLQGAALVRPDEGEPELSRLDAFTGENGTRELDCGRFVHLLARAVVDVYLDHRLRCVPVCSACALYASTIRCTSL